MTNNPSLLLEERTAAPVVLEQHASGAFRFEAVVSEGDYINRNGRRYRMDALRTAFDKFIADAHREPGAVDHPDPYGDRHGITDVGIYWESVRYEGNLVVATGRIIETAKGMALKALIQANVAVGFSTRGYGLNSVEVTDGDTGRTVMEITEYELSTIDAVLTPSVRHARVRTYRQEQEEKEAMTIKTENPAPLLLDGQPLTAEALNNIQEALRQNAEKMQELRDQIEESNRKAAAALVEQAITGAIAGHTFAAAIATEIDALRELGLTLTVENAAAVVERIKGLVEGVAAAGNHNVTTGPRGDTSAPQEEAPTAEVAISDTEREDLEKAGLL